MNAGKKPVRILMRKRLTGIFVYFLAAGTLLAAPLLQAPNWQDYSYADDGFSLSAPSKPAFTQQSRETASGTVQIHNYSVQLDSDGGVMISSANFPPMDVPAKDLLQGGKNGALQSVHATLVSEKEITLGGYPGLEFEAKSDAFHVRARMYMVKTRLVTILVIAPAGVPYPADSSRILDSIKLIAPAP